jgi:site-specific DNA recombinase
MVECVIYARVSSREQQEEGYSLAAQLKACYEFCEREHLVPKAEFVEVESAGKTGRRRFGEMLDFLIANPDVRTVVAHKLDRLYRNFRDAMTLEEDLGARARYVVTDIPDTPQGELLRDVNLSVSKYYLNNLREEVKKGMDEKVAQGGWPHLAPMGYLNDPATRSVIVDPVVAPLIQHAFKRYASGLVSMSDLCEELRSMGLVTRGRNKVYVSKLDGMLKNPFYCGRVRWKGQLHKGIHEPLVSPELFDAVQRAFAPNRRGNNSQKRSYVLRDFLWCAECGAKITAGTHKGYVYYRCTHGKGDCSQRSYTRDTQLEHEVADVLSRIAIGPDILAALVEEARVRETGSVDAFGVERRALEVAQANNQRRAGVLLDTLLDGVIDKDSYSAKAAELENEAAALERRLGALSEPPTGLTAQVEALARQAATAHMDFERADDGTKREILAGVLCNLEVEGGHIASYQWKDPFGVLEHDSERALISKWSG